MTSTIVVTKNQKQHNLLAQMQILVCTHHDIERRPKVLGWGGGGGVCRGGLVSGVKLTGTPAAHDLVAATTAFERPFIPRPSSA